MGNVCDKELFEKNKDIINSVKKFQLQMDIKLIETPERDQYLYFKKVVKNRERENIRVLKGFPAEEIIGNYGLIILDYLVSALLPVSIVLDCPTIIYLKDTSYLKEETKPDLEERFYLVNNKSDLEKHISLYASGKLKSKFSSDMVDKYAFPINAGDPGIRISDYMRKKTSEYVLKKR